MKKTPEETSAWFAHRLKELGLTQEQFAEVSGFAAADVSRYKNQKQRPRVEQIERFAFALQIDIVSLLIGLGAVDPVAVTTPTIASGKKSITWSRK